MTTTKIKISIEIEVEVSGNYHSASNGSYVTKEDMVDKKYTEEDMIKFAFDTYYYISGIMKVPFNKVSENRTHADKLKEKLTTKNKQDNEK
jgi:hypothetical protein